MRQYQRLFMIASPNLRHTAALERAVAIAKATDAALHLAVFIEEGDLLGRMASGTALRQSMEQEAWTWLRDEATQLRHDGLEVTCEVQLSRQVMKDMLEHVEEMEPDLVIKDVHHESALRRVFLTPPDWQLLRDCAAPLHLVSEVRCPLPRVIIAAVDTLHPDSQHTGLNERVIREANAMAIQCDADLHLLHAWDVAQTRIADFGAGAVTMPGFNSEVRRSAQLAFEHLADAHGVPEAHRHFVSGPASHAIGEYAAHHRADVIVMGSSQRKGAQGLLGSTTEHVLQHLPCNVLAARQETTATP
ncbi:universal stress protein [Pseudomonas sp. zfem002]|uniref:universal stress protein n=1 Tax=Pseudomonas sp. zfem002 TaxID=3078197 RepID=UPI002927B893|nr:universal stress protein [Pseudomonas sp. zfem002]MDU9393384.1 universal stress protein [Pseudomonas sp. zfem002]